MGRPRGNKNLTVAIQEAIVIGYKNGLTQSTLAKQFQLHQSTISKVLKREKLHGCVKKPNRPGRPRCTSHLVDRNILRISRDNPRFTASDVMREISAGDSVSVTVRTIRNRLIDGGLRARRPAKKPLISKKNRTARKKYAKEHLSWTAEMWEKVIWSDESKFLLFGTDGITYVRRPDNARYDPKYQLPTVKHGGGSLMVWGCFSASGVGPLHRINGIMTKEVYEEILQDVFLPWARQNFGRAFIFQQDNDPKHSSNLVKQWFKKRRVRVLEWPSQSPDLNPIENLWKELGRRVSARKARNINERFEQLKEEWERIPNSFLAKLIASLPRRCQAVLDAKGFSTKY